MPILSPGDWNIDGNIDLKKKNLESKVRGLQAWHSISLCLVFTITQEIYKIDFAKTLVTPLSQKPGITI